jgi:hypothetical protein
MRGVLAGLIVLFGMSAGAAPATAGPRMSWWEAVDALAAHLPLGKAQVEQVLATTLSETGKGGNDLFHLYHSTPVALAQGAVIANVDLRIPRSGAHPGFMVIELDGACVSLAEVRRHYGDLVLSGVPRGHSIHETTSHTSQRPWGTLAFGFAESNRECLAWIAFDPTKKPAQ